MEDDSLSRVISDLKAEIAQYHAAIRELETTVAVLEARRSASSSRSVTVTPRSAQISLEDLGVDHVPGHPTSLLNRIRAVIEKFGDQEFTVRHIEAALKQRGELPKANKPRGRIAMEVKKLVEKNEIECVFEGTGGTPNRYRRIIKRESLDAATSRLSSTNGCHTDAGGSDQQGG